MSHQSSLLLCLVFLLVAMIITANGLNCHICGQFNDGVGSITPCLNYTEANAHLHLKECPRKTDKFCVVSFHFFNYNFFLQVSSKNCFSPFGLCGEKAERRGKNVYGDEKKLFVVEISRKANRKYVMSLNAMGGLT